MVEINPNDEVIEASHCHHAKFDMMSVNESGTEGEKFPVCRLCHKICQVVKLLVEEK